MAMNSTFDALKTERYNLWPLLQFFGCHDIPSLDNTIQEILSRVIGM